jgi:hypothetical protein
MWVMLFGAFTAKVNEPTSATLLLDQHPQAALAVVSRWLGGRAEYLKA